MSGRTPTSASAVFRAVVAGRRSVPVDWVVPADHRWVSARALAVEADSRAVDFALAGFAQAEQAQVREVLDKFASV